MRDDSRPADDSTTSPDPIPVAVEERRFVQLIPQLFIFPLVIVTIGVLVYVFFSASAQDERPVTEILQELQSGWPQTRNRAAFELAMRTQEMAEVGSGKRFDADTTRAIVDALENVEADDKSRRYLVLALGRAGDPELAQPVLLKILEQERGTASEARIEAIRGLGLSQAPEAIEPLYEELGRFGGEQEWEPRLITLSALAQVALSPELDDARSERIEATLAEHVRDPHWMVRWNMASVLAQRFDNAAGVATLRKLLDREFIETQVPEEANQDPWILAAIRGLGAVEDEASYDTIRGLRQDPSAQVRNAVFLFEERRAEAGAQGGGDASLRAAGSPGEQQA